MQFSHKHYLHFCKISFLNKNVFLLRSLQYLGSRILGLMRDLNKLLFWADTLMKKFSFLWSCDCFGAVCVNIDLAKAKWLQSRMFIHSTLWPNQCYQNGKYLRVQRLSVSSGTSYFVVETFIVHLFIASVCKQNKWNLQRVQRSDLRLL